jgi:hypothetical protein
MLKFSLPSERLHGSTERKRKMLATMPRPKRNDIAVKIDRDVIRKAKTICGHRDISLAEYLTGLLSPVIDREYDRFKAELANEDKPKRPSH